MKNIELNFQNINDLESEFIETMKYYEEMLYWVTDRLGVVNKTSYGMTFGNIVLLIAAYERMNILMGVANQNKTAFSADMLNKREALVRSCEEYWDKFKDRIEAEMNVQFEKTVLNALKTTNKGKEGYFNVLEDITYFCSERDVMQLFIRGSKHFTINNYQDQISEDDKDIKKYILDKIATMLKKDYPVDQLNNLNKDILPNDFWWRHVKWI